METVGGESLYEKALRQASAPGSALGAKSLPPPRASAAVVLWRPAGDGGCEVYWVQRAEVLPFMGGWHAFPGGGLSRSDAALPVSGAPRGLAPDLAPAAGLPAAAGLPEALRDTVDSVGPDLLPGIVACALRELFEETG